MTTTTKIAGEAMTDEWRTAFDDRHEFDVYPEHFMSGLRNEFAAGWHAAMKSQARALLASKGAVPQPVSVYPQGVMGIPPYSPPGSGSMTVEPGISWNAAAPAQPMLEKLAGILASEIECDLFEQHVAPALDVARKVFAGPIAPAQPCGEDAAEQADEAVTDDVFDWLETEVTAISCRYHGDPSYDHDAYWMRDRVVKLIGEARNVFARDELLLAAKEVLANGHQHDVGGGDVFIGTCDSTERLQRALDAARAKDSK